MKIVKNREKMAAAAVLKIPFPVLGIVSFCKYIVINVGLSPVGFLDTTVIKF